MHKFVTVNIGIVELCAKFVQIMRDDFQDYARIFLPIMRTFLGFVLYIIGTGQ